VQDARYWRDQAALCLEMARQMSDRRTADNLRATAAQYFAKATALEAEISPPARDLLRQRRRHGASHESSQPSHPGPDWEQSAMSRFFYHYSDGTYTIDSEGEEHDSREHAIAAAYQVAAELSRNRASVHGSIIVKNEAGDVIVEVPLRREADSAH
jgi:hypothetical protein